MATVTNNYDEQNFVNSSLAVVVGVNSAGTVINNADMVNSTGAGRYVTRVYNNTNTGQIINDTVLVIN